MNPTDALAGALIATTPTHWACPHCPTHLPIDYTPHLDMNQPGDYVFMRMVETDESLQHRRDHTRTHLTQGSTP